MFASVTNSGNGRNFSNDAAQAIVNFNQTAMARPRDASASTATSRGPSSLVDFATTLEALASQSPALMAQLEELMARLAREHLTSTDLAAPSKADFLAMLSTQFPASRGGTVVRAFWWGFHIQISHEDLEQALGAADVVNKLVGLIGGSIPSPAQPFIVLAAQFVATAIGAVRGVDHGNGIYLSMSWFAPGVFVPTSV